MLLKMELEKLSKIELLEKCKEIGITKYKSKNKNELILLINSINIKKSLSTVNKYTSFNKEIKYIDLFCGLGAFHNAFDLLQTEDTKYKCVFSCDIDNNIRKIYKENYGITPEGDINKINIENIPDFDILCGGFPCQPFSIAGYRKGFEDKGRGDLIFNIVEIIKVKQPRVIFLENVKNIA